jgi:hypothetical protein
VRLLELELWRDINNYECLYQVSSIGNVRSLNRSVYHSGNKSQSRIKGKLLKPRINNRGYWDLRLSKDGKRRTHFIHRLMGEAFLSNPFKKSEINHKNGIKTDNRLENLEWVTHSENMIHAFKLGLCKGRKMQTIIVLPFKSKRKTTGKKIRHQIEK